LKNKVLLSQDNKPYRLGMNESTDGQIARLVYELYGLSAEEVRIVEGKQSAPPRVRGAP
jgi:hypothetical protein